MVLIENLVLEDIFSIKDSWWWRVYIKVPRISHTVQDDFIGDVPRVNKPIAVGNSLNLYIKINFSYKLTL